MNRRNFLFSLLVAVASPTIVYSAITSAKKLPRKFKAVYSFEMEQDLVSYYGIEPDRDFDEFTTRMAKEITKEIDREVLESLMRSLPT